MAGSISDILNVLNAYDIWPPAESYDDDLELPGIGQIEEGETVYATSLDEVLAGDGPFVLGTDDPRLREWWEQINRSSRAENRAVLRASGCVQSRLNRIVHGTARFISSVMAGVSIFVKAAFCRTPSTLRASSIGKTSRREASLQTRSGANSFAAHSTYFSCTSSSTIRSKASAFGSSWRLGPTAIALTKLRSIVPRT